MTELKQMFSDAFMIFYFSKPHVKNKSVFVPSVFIIKYLQESGEKLPDDWIEQFLNVEIKGYDLDRVGPAGFIMTPNKEKADNSNHALG